MEMKKPIFFFYKFIPWSLSLVLGAEGKGGLESTSQGGYNRQPFLFFSA